MLRDRGREGGRESTKLLTNTIQYMNIVLLVMISTTC